MKEILDFLNEQSGIRLLFYSGLSIIILSIIIEGLTNIFKSIATIFENIATIFKNKYNKEKK